MRAHLFLFGVTLLAAPELSGQRLTGEGSCTRPDTTHAIPVGDRPDHLFALARVSCTWTKPFEIAGSQSTGGTAVQFDELTGNTSRFHGVFSDVMSSGDTVHYRYQGTGTLRDGTPQTAEWSWTYAGGTGKLRKLQGKGSCKGSWNREGIKYLALFRRIPTSNLSTADLPPCVRELTTE
jgi:hypothetical protein